MAKKIIRGLKSIKLGAIAEDGGMGTVLSEIGYTVNDTAIFATEDGTNQEFFVEEQDEPIESVETQKGVSTLKWSTNNLEADTLISLFGGTKIAAATNRIATLGSITGGTLYTTGTYNAVALTGGTGTGATANIVVAGGAVTSVTMVSRGSGYTAADSLSALAANIGGTGSGFSVPAATVATVKESYSPPSSAPERELSIELIDKKGNKLEVVRAKVNALFQLNFAKTALGQVDIAATVLGPTKEGVDKWTLTYA